MFVFLVILYIFLDQSYLCQRISNNLINSDIFNNDLRPYLSRFSKPGINLAESTSIWNYDLDDEKNEMNDILEYSDADEMYDNYEETNIGKNNFKNLNLYDMENFKNDQQLSFYESLQNLPNIFSYQENDFQPISLNHDGFIFPTRKIRKSLREYGPYYMRNLLTNYLEDSELDINNEYDMKKKLNHEMKSKLENQSHNKTERPKGNSSYLGNKSKYKYNNHSKNKSKDNLRNKIKNNLKTDIDDNLRDGVKKSEKKDDAQIEINSENKKGEQPNQTKTEEISDKKVQKDTILISRPKKEYISDVIYSPIQINDKINAENLKDPNNLIQEKKYQEKVNDKSYNIDEKKVNSTTFLKSNDYIDEPSKEHRIRKLKRLKKVRKQKIKANNSIIGSNDSQTNGNSKENTNEIKLSKTEFDGETGKLMREKTKQSDSKINLNNQINDMKNNLNDQIEKKERMEVIKMIKRVNDTGIEVEKNSKNEYKNVSITDESLKSHEEKSLIVNVTGKITFPKVIALPSIQQVNQTMKLNLVNKTVDDYIDDIENSETNKNKIKHILY